MKRILFILLLPLLLFSVSLKAQLEKVIVEKYYVSDQFDATDTTYAPPYGNNKLDSGSVTYRIYIDMKPGYKLTKIYGDSMLGHPLKISSTAHFFNNKDRGENLGLNIVASHINDNTTALDTWLTIGQVTSTHNSKAYFGVLKSNDMDSSIIAGKNNDGGSAGIIGGLLINANPNAGIPLTKEDGMSLSTNIPTNWIGSAFQNLNQSFDSTIFGKVKLDSQFVSTEVLLQNSGVMGVDPNTNQVIIAQLTTKGEITFELNIEITDSTGNIIGYVANDSALRPANKAANFLGEKLSRYLKYPFNLLCDCPDANYLEYNPDRDCDNHDSCKTLIVFGCMDPLACNYNPNANYSVPNLCCYPGYCQNRDIAVVCQTILAINDPTIDFEFTLFPNPAQLTFDTDKHR